MKDVKEWPGERSLADAVMRQTPSARVARRKQKTQEVLLQVALGLFSEKGIYWTKIEDITERADIGKGTFYKYFPTKEALIRILLQRGIDTLKTRIKQELGTAGSGNQIVAKTIHAQVDFYLHRPEYLLLFHQVRGLMQLEVDHVRELREVYHHYVQELGHLLRPALCGHHVREEAAREFAMAVSAFTAGLLTYHLLFEKVGQVKRKRELLEGQIGCSIQALLESLS
jgi:AcrR family transcriptional regulator